MLCFVHAHEAGRSTSGWGDCVTRCAQSMNSIRNYFLNTGDAADSLHHSMDSWFWWCWNANSGDTGGIVSPGVTLSRVSAAQV